MFNAPGNVLVAFFHRPETTTTVVAVICLLLGLAGHWFAEWSTRVEIPDQAPGGRPGPLPGGSIEPPAVVAALTSRMGIPRAAITATAIDLASRDWLRFTTLDGELVVVTRSGRGSGEALRPFEQQVLNHLISRSYNGIASANTLAASHHRLDRSWRRRFRASVRGTAVQLGVMRPRYTPIELAPVGAAILIGLLAAWFSARRGQEIAVTDSWVSRLIWLVAVAGLVALAAVTVRRALGRDLTPTPLGLERGRAWMGFRHRLAERIPPGASVLASPSQQSALAVASAIGVAEHVLDQVPVAPEDHRMAWSTASGTPRTVRISYPIRPGYGRHPVYTAIFGGVSFFGGRWLRDQLERIADGELFADLLDRLPGQAAIFERIAEVLALVCVIPIVAGVWAMFAGVVDSFMTRERTGAIVRSRRPREVLGPRLVGVVRPFAGRDHFATYLAVDDGRRRWIDAWMADEYTAAPQGAQARVRATPLLGYVRATEPIGSSTPPPPG